MNARPYRVAARYYRARPPYSDELLPTLSRRLNWDGTGRLLDIGCGPGVLALALAPSFAEVVGLDPEASMLAEARVAGDRAGAAVRWVNGRAEEIPDLGLGRFQAVTLGQSFHWMDKDAVAGIVYDALEPGGSILLIHHAAPPYENPGTLPAGPGHPPIPHDVINATLMRYLGHGKNVPNPDSESYTDLLARTPFGPAERVMLPGHVDLVRSVDDVIDNYLSTSFAAPDLFGDRLDEFRAELTAELAALTPTGHFWEWPGDTEVLVALKPGTAPER